MKERLLFRPSRSRGWIGTAVGLLVALTLAQPGPAWGQTATPRSPAATTDAYGNARASYVERRSVGAFEHEWQRSLAGDHLRTGRRTAPQAAFTPFRLSGDGRGMGLPLAPFLQNSRRGATGVSNWQAYVFRRYGGFDKRNALVQGENFFSSFERRRALIAATSLNAPIHRANARFGTRTSLGAQLSQTPFLEPPQTQESQARPSVDMRMAIDSDSAHQRIRAKAWMWFHAGSYRQAARAFETSILMNPEDTASRLGRLFSHVSLGELRTASAVLRALVHRVPAPFMADLDFTVAYSSPDELRRVRTTLTKHLRRAEAQPQEHALEVLALWYLGGREEAEILAARLASEAPREVFALWPEQMRAVVAAPQPVPGTDQP